NADGDVALCIPEFEVPLGTKLLYISDEI
ncbi:hypothetical protein VXE61_21570, partial [Acinetobacter nosocomialis]